MCTMQERLLNLKNEALAQILAATNAAVLEEIRVEYLGRSKGKLTDVIRKLPELDTSQRVIIGQFANEVKKVVEEAITTQKNSLAKSEADNIGRTEWLDVTLPGIRPTRGHLHVGTQVLQEVLDIFKRLGYQTADGFEVESDYYNFTCLNMPPDSPSRDAQATFYLDTKGSKATPGQIITRTQLSGMQVRIMEKTKPPMRVVIPGKVFRVDQVDPSHSFEFWQLEGMLIDKNVRWTDLLGTMEFVLKELFGQDIRLRFYCTYFAFVEPGVQAYMSCSICKQKGCSFCKYTGWVEIMPAGMVHPNVISSGGLDPNTWGGFAFCIGLSRAVVLKYQIDDLRVLTNPDLRILKQF